MSYKGTPKSKLLDWDGYHLNDESALLAMFDISSSHVSTSAVFRSFVKEWNPITWGVEWFGIVSRAFSVSFRVYL
jgi:hypothetical protein